MLRRSFLLALPLLVPPCAVAAPISVSFSGTQGTIGHGAVRVNHLTLSGDSYAGYYNSLPVLAPFRSPTGAGGRFTDYPGVNFPLMAYAKLSGAGAFQFTPTGTLFGFPSGPASFPPPGTFLPMAAHTGTLLSALGLPNGVVLPAGTVLYSDFAGLTVDVDNPASYWLDAASGEEHRTYENGTWSFFYEQCGEFVKLAEYVDVTHATVVNLQAGTVAITWSGTPIPVAGVLLPASGSAVSSDPLNGVGILTNEMNRGFAGFYGQFPGRLTIAFDVDRAVLTPEPGALTLLSLAALLAFAARRRPGRRAE